MVDQTLEQQERVHREREFHNQWANSVDLDELLVREAFEAPTALENRYILSLMGELKGKRILDMGCGAGESSVYFASQGAEVYGCDIAENFMVVANRLAAKHGVTACFSATDSAALPFPDGFFDYAYCNGVLHHVDIPATSREISRVLIKGGRGFFIEPLPYNPAINVYRILAKEVRTEDEKPLNYSQINQLKNFYGEVKHEEFWCFTLLIFFYFFLVKRWHPGKVRYWKRVIEVGHEFEGIFSRLKRMDDIAFKYLPFLKPLAWNTVITVTN